MREVGGGMRRETTVRMVENAKAFSTRDCHKTKESGAAGINFQAAWGGRVCVECQSKFNMKFSLTIAAAEAALLPGLNILKFYLL